MSATLQDQMLIIVGANHHSQFSFLKLYNSRGVVQFHFVFAIQWTHYPMCFYISFVAQIAKQYFANQASEKWNVTCKPEFLNAAGINNITNAFKVKYFCSSMDHMGEQ